MSRLSKIARAIILAVLFGMLITSFAFWGVGDMLRAGRGIPIVAEVGSTKITAQEVRERFDRMLQQYQTRSGQGLSVTQAVASGLHIRALEDSIKATVIDLAAKELGIAISDEQIRKAIAEIPGFKGPGGRFDPAAYRSALQRAGLSEASFIADLRRELASTQMLGSIQNGAVVPGALRDSLYRYRREKRVAELFILPFDSIRDVPQPTAEQLQAHLDANKARFQIKEYRALSYVVLTLDDVLGEVPVSEEQLQRLYQEHLPEHTRAEMRDIDQVVVSTEEEARRIVELTKAGKSLEDAGKEVLNREAVIKLGAMARKDLVGQFAEGAFTLAQGAIGGPFQSPLGWHVARINKIEPGHTPTFAELRARLEQDYRREAAPDLLYKRIRDFDIALGRSDTLAEAAKAIDAQVQQVEATNDQGVTPSGGRALTSPAASEIVRTAFSLGEGKQSAVIDTPQGDSFVVKVDRVTPPRDPPLAEIEVLVRADWQRIEREKLGEARAQEIVGRLNAVASFESQARAAGQAIKVSKPVDRYSVDRDSNLTNELVAELFKLAPGRSSTRKVDGGMAIMRLKEIVPADPAATAEDAKQFTTEISTNMTSDLVAAMLSAFERRYGRKINLATLQQTFRTEPQ